MKILGINVFHFGRLKNKKMPFRPGVNIITGGNEAGKTTTHVFLKSMLYGMTPKEDDYATYLPWEEDGVYGGSMRISFEGVEYEIQRSFLASGPSLEIWQEPEHSLVEDPESLLRRALCGVSKKVFENSVCVEQTEYADGRIALEDVRFYLSSLNQEKQGQSQLQKAQKLLEGKQRPEEAVWTQAQEDAYQKVNTDLEDYEEQRNVLHQTYAQIHAKKEASQAGLENVDHQKQPVSDEKEKKLRKEMIGKKDALAQLDEVDEDYLDKPNRIGTAVMTLGILGGIVIWFLLCNGTLAFSGGSASIYTLIAIVGAVVVFIIGLLITVVRAAKKSSIRSALEEWNDAKKEAEDAEEAYQTYVNESSAQASRKGGRAALEAQIQQLTGQEREIIRRLQEVQSQYETQALLLETMEKSRKEKDKQEFDYHAMEVAIQAMNEVEDSSAQLLSGGAFGLPDIAAGYLSKITNGAYKVIKVSEDHQVLVGDGKDFWPVSGLSIGARGQVYLALRLASSHLIDPENQLPLLFDDVFAFFDEKRMEESMKLVRSLGRQLIMFTCHTRESKVS